MTRQQVGTIKAVIWDLGGVILRTEDRQPRERWEAKLGLAPGELDRLVFEGELGKQAALGQANVRDIWDSVGSMLGLSADQLRELEIDFWSGDRIDDELVAYIRDLRPGFQTSLLSNAWPSVRDTLENRWEITEIFDVITLSSEVGIAKPDPRIYALTLEALDLPAERTVFVDDFERNVVAARQLGMVGLQFQNRDQVRHDLGVLLGLT
ncbi:MAG: HAD family phosphatase [Anaerolineales bacterium]|jgi:HAD superfamily hydrolase (TIGR01509 family)